MPLAREPVPLAVPACYLAEVERLGARAQEQRGLDGVRQALPGGEVVTLAELWPERQALARRIADVVARGDYVLGPADALPVRIGDKHRVLHRFGFLDQVVVAVLARRLAELAEPSYSDALYSYRRGRSVAGAIGAFGHFLRAHRATHGRRARGVFVLRRDIKAYGESIRTDPDSHLWKAFAPILAQLAPLERPIADRLLHAAVRPSLRARDGTLTAMTLGTPTGSPLQPLVNNLYLTGLDHDLAAIDGAFYARFGDDLLFAHPQAEVARAAAEQLHARLTGLGLEISEDKGRDLYFTHCGRPSDAWPAARGTSRVEYLGVSIDFPGTVALKPVRVRALMADLRRRWRNVLALSKSTTLEARRALLCRVTSATLDPRVPLSASASATLLTAVSDRGQLRQLDYQIALALAERLAGRRGVRAFRRVPYRSLRAAGLASLVVARNRRHRSTGHRTTLRATRGASPHTAERVRA